VYGLKPTFGRVPIFPPSLFMPHSVIGPMARTVDDAMLMLATLAGPDPRDPFAWPIPFDLERATVPGVEEVRVGVT
jgi:aspartyl-tRNA(Asn)/glutamyl-tRNA(Gln) amidotransferase subunit A